MESQSETPCPICNLEAQDVVCTADYGERVAYDCARCGKFTITGTAKAVAAKHPFKLSAWIRERNEHGVIVPEINSQTLKEIEKNLPDYSPTLKQLLFLRNLEKKTGYPGKELTLIPHLDFPLAWATCEAELIYYVRSLIDRDLLRPTRDRTMGDPTLSFEITSDGWDYLDAHSGPSAISDQAFVAMSFSSDMKSVWENAIRPAIARAGYKPVRVDVEPHIDRIDSKIITEIKNSRFLVAEVTEQKQGVYFEAGYALGMSLPVVWCVRKDDLDNLHFDTRQYNHIVWESELQLEEKLYYSICAVIGKR